MRIHNVGNKSHVLTMARPIREKSVSFLIFFFIAFVFSLIFINSNANAKTDEGVSKGPSSPSSAASSPDTDAGTAFAAPTISPYAWELGSEPPPEGSYYFPDRTRWGGKVAGWEAFPTTSDLPPGQGFPEQFKMKCSVEIEGLVLKGSCDDGRFKKIVKGRFLGLLVVHEWSESDDKKGPTLKVGVRVVLQSLSVPGHTYVVRDQEQIFLVGSGGDPSPKRQVDLTFVHLPAPTAPAPVPIK